MKDSNWPSAWRYFFQLALSLLCRFKDGPAKAAVPGSGLTGLVSGASIANIVTTGAFTIPLMQKVGFPPTEAAAVQALSFDDKRQNKFISLPCGLHPEP